MCDVQCAHTLSYDIFLPSRLYRSTKPVLYEIPVFLTCADKILPPLSQHNVCVKNCSVIEQYHTYI